MRFAIIALYFFVLSGCMAGTKVRTQPDPGDPVAYFPKMCVGDTFTKRKFSPTNALGRDNYTYKVLKVNQDGGFVVALSTEGDHRDERMVLNNQYQIIQLVDLITGEDKEIAEPPQNMLNFPLFVGKHWKDSFRGMAVNGQYHEYENTYLVTDYLKTKTALGEYDTFKVKIKHRNKEWSPSRDSLTETYYYSPKLKIVIKSVPSWRMVDKVIKANMSNCGELSTEQITTKKCTRDSDCAGGLICKDNGNCVAP